MLDVIHYVENQTRYDRGKGNKTQSFMTICEVCSLVLIHKYISAICRAHCKISRPRIT